MYPTDLDSPARIPLEQFLRDYVAIVGGEWEEVEPQVYDLLLPETLAAGDEPSESLLKRITFDPEALADHPRAQLASLGTPLVDQLLSQAVERAQFLELYLTGLNLHSPAWSAALPRAFSVDRSATFAAVSARILDFPQIVFWFETTFASDQREQEILPIAIDLHYGRQVRNLDVLLKPERLAASPMAVYPTASLISRDVAYRRAQEQLLRTIGGLANVRNRELVARLDRQTLRMTQYYDDLQKELDEQERRASSRTDADQSKFVSRRETLSRERDLRVAEVRKKHALSVKLRLLNTLVVHQPKLAVEVAISDSKPRSSDRSTANLSLVWDPLLESWEAANCPRCDRSTFELFRLHNALLCETCQAAPRSSSPRRPR